MPLRIAYTAMHGVGHRLAVRALARAGFDGVAAEPSQADPDGAFRTVSFPNPEEPGAMDRVLALAAETRAELVLANDPDADRLAAAVPDPAGKRVPDALRQRGGRPPRRRRDRARRHRREAEARRHHGRVLQPPVAHGPRPGRRVPRDAHRLQVDRRRGAAGEKEGLGFVFGYEEALGYSVGTLVRDKDGIGAALHLAGMARFLKKEGRTLLERLDELLVAHGLCHQVQWSVVLPGAEGRARIDAAMAQLRTRPPERIGTSPVVRVLDAAEGEERVRGERRPSGLPRSDVLAFQAEDGARLTVRPSGTEPKIKFYLELVGEARERRDIAPARARLEAEGQALKSALTKELKLA